MSAVESIGAFLQTPVGEVHVLSLRPLAPCRDVAVLFVAPFAEEMNRTRRMVALQARAFAARGYEVLVPDLIGTGDSSGEFRDATWSGWLATLDAARDHLGGREVVLWSLRSGALLAAEWAAQRSTRRPRHLLWQPVTDGARYLDQFLRLRVASAISGTDAKRESVSALRARLIAGEMLEIAGYELGPALAEALSARTLATCLRGHPAVLQWLELTGDPSAALPPGPSAIAARLAAADHTVELQACFGPPFWATVETTVADSLIAPSVEALAKLEVS